jgi:hypothetical protein
VKPESLQSTTDRLNELTNNYVIDTLHADEQMEREDVVSLAKNGQLSIPKNTQSLEFVSKPFFNTIQNDNLRSGSFYETWSTISKAYELNTSNHVLANSYANGWIIDPKEICSRETACVTNADGSYNMELVLEFWPQRVLYLGLFITVGSLLGCIMIMLWHSREESRRSKQTV